MPTLIDRSPLQVHSSIANSVHARFDQSGYSELRRLDVMDSGNGMLRIEGRVSSYYMKQVAQALALSVPGVERLENAAVVE